MDRVLRNVGATVQVTLYNSSGVPANPPGGALTADVKDSAGLAISGSPFTVTNPPAVAGVLTFDLPAALATMDTYDVTWNIPDGSKRYTQFEMVGGFHFTIAELRAFDSTLADTAKYTPAKILEARENVEARFEEVAGVAFAPRGRRKILSGPGSSKLILPDFEVTKLVSAKVDGTALTSGELADVKVHPFGLLEWDGGTWAAGIRNVECFYEHGMAFTPEPIRRAAMQFAKHLLLPPPSERSERATAVFDELGGYRLTLAGRDGPTGLPDVDAVLEQFGRKVEGFA